MDINNNFLKLQQSYLFSTVAKKVDEYQTQNPGRAIYRLGIGDVTLPLAPVVVEAMQKAVLEMGSSETFRGYGEEQGYAFLRNELSLYYRKKGVSLDIDEIFVSDGAKSDLGNILDIFSTDNEALIPDPVYPVYIDTNTMAGRKINFIYGNSENSFLPMPDNNTRGDIIYLCSPNNPTGAVYSKEQLKLWIEFALKNNSVILFDSAYEAFVTDSSLPTSIYQIEGAKECAIEFCSFSKTAGFTGTRCGYTVVPKALKRNDISLNALWLRRQTTKFNGVPYIVQRGAQAVLSEEGLKQTGESIKYYMENAKLIAKALDKLGIWYTGGSNSPYIWLKCPEGLSSWDFFDLLLSKANIVGTPGSGFGKSGEGFFRLTAFGNRENIIKALENLSTLEI